MNTSTSIFKFFSIRNPTDETTGPAGLEIQPSTQRVKALIEIIESDKKQSEKINLINQQLEAFIQSKAFFKTKFEVAETTGAINPASARQAKPIIAGVCDDRADDLDELYENLYDNIVVRTITKSNTNEVFKALTDSIRLLHQRLNPERAGGEDVQKIKIVLPERLVISFSPPAPPPAAAKPPAEKESAALFAQIQDLTEQKRQLQKSIAEYEAQISAERQRFASLQAEENQAPSVDSSATPSETARSAETPTPGAAKRVDTNPAIDQLVATTQCLRESEREINARLVELNNRAFQQIPATKYAFIGERWVDIRGFDETRPPKIEGDSIMVYSHGCYLKFPFQVADLRVVEQQSVGYLPAEIAHINNTQQGELHEKVTRRLKRIETFESLITEDETFRETDTQSTEKFTLEKAASEIHAEEMSANVNTSVSGTYGVVTASLDAGFSASQSSQNANSAAQSYAKEIVQRVVDRVSNKVRKERSLKTLEEFEETVKHVIDNRKWDSPKSYVYRWLTKLSRATLKNYGKRLIFQIDVAHPSHYYLTRAIKKTPNLNLPADPRELKAYGVPIFTAESITRENYLAWGGLYNAKLEPPPMKTISVGYSNAAGGGAVAEKGTITIPTGYCCKTAYTRFFIRASSNNDDHITVFVGRAGLFISVAWGGPVHNFVVPPMALDNETGSIPVSIWQAGHGYSVNIEIECSLCDEAFTAWQVKCFDAIIEAYESLKAEAENKMSEFNPNAPGLNPTRKRELIKTELKKGALSKMFRCNPFWITDNYKVGNEYDPDCCKDSLNGEKIRFLETLFDWNNITYELYPYRYADKDNWNDLLDLTDDPHFEAFLQASYATVRIPVHRDTQKETAAVNFILYNSIANYQVVPAGIKPLLDELGSGKPTEFTTGLNGEQLAVPTEVVDLGIFTVPTDLVILECGVENGVKPIGFPQTAVEGTDVSIPKQYSPAIIADSCPVTPPNPADEEPVTPNPADEEVL